MAKHLSHQHAVNAIRLMYEKQGFQIGDAVPGKFITKELQVDISEAPFSALYAFVDEYIVLLRSQSMYFLTADHEKYPSAMTFYRLSIRQLRSLASIRTLCSYGLDANARLQLRLLFETAQLWVRFRIDQESLNEYSECKSLKTANEFWHKYLSKEKTEHYLKHHMLEQGFNWIGGMDDQIKDLKQKLSLVAHPTYLADYHETLADWKSESDTCVLTQPLEASYFTLSKSIFVTAMPFAIFPDPPYKIASKSIRDKGKGWNPISHPTESWEDYNKQLRNMFPALFLMATRFFIEFDEINKADSR